MTDNNDDDGNDDDDNDDKPIPRMLRTDAALKNNYPGFSLGKK